MNLNFNKDVTKPEANAMPSLFGGVTQGGASNTGAPSLFGNPLAPGTGAAPLFGGAPNTGTASNIGGASGAGPAPLFGGSLAPATGTGPVPLFGGSLAPATGAGPTPFFGANPAQTAQPIAFGQLKTTTPAPAVIAPVPAFSASAKTIPTAFAQAPAASNPLKDTAVPNLLFGQPAPAQPAQATPSLFASNLTKQPDVPLFGAKQPDVAVAAKQPDVSSQTQPASLLTSSLASLPVSSGFAISNPSAPEQTKSNPVNINPADGKPADFKDQNVPQSVNQLSGSNSNETTNQLSSMKNEGVPGFPLFTATPSGLPISNNLFAARNDLKQPSGNFFSAPAPTTAPAPEVKDPVSKTQNPSPVFDLQIATPPPLGSGNANLSDPSKNVIAAQTTSPQQKPDPPKLVSNFEVGKPSETQMPLFQPKAMANPTQPGATQPPAQPTQTANVLDTQAQPKKQENLPLPTQTQDAPKLQTDSKLTSTRTSQSENG